MPLMDEFFKTQSNMDAASQAAIATQKKAYDFAMEKQQREEAISAIKALRNPNAIRTMGANPNGATQAAPDQSSPSLGQIANGGSPMGDAPPDQSSPSLGQIANGGSPMGDAPPDQSSPSLGAAQPGQPAQATPSLGSAQPAPSSSAAIMPPAAPRRTALQTLQDTSDQLSGQINVLQNQGTLTANTMANALRVQKTQVDEKLPLAEKEAADTQLKTDTANYQKWAAVNSQQDLNNLTSTAPDGLKTMLAKIQIYPDLNGQYNLADPRVQQFVRDAQNHASTVVEKSEMAAKLANTAHQIADEQQAKANLAQKTQYENARIGVERANTQLGRDNLNKPIFQNGQFIIPPKVDSKGNVTQTASAVNVEGLQSVTPDMKSMAQGIADGNLPAITGYSLRNPRGMAVMAEVMRIKPGYDAKDYVTNQAGEKAFTSGKKGDIARSFNVITSHLDTLGKLADGLDNGNIKVINQFGNAVAAQTGNPAPVTFDAAKRIVSDEIVKAIVGTSGALGDRDEVQKTIDRANSPAQLKGVIQTYKELASGQLQGLERQYETSTGKKDFRTRILSQPSQQAFPSAASASTNGANSDLSRWNSTKSGEQFKRPDGTMVIKP